MKTTLNERNSRMSHNTQELMKNNTVQMEASEVRYKTLLNFILFIFRNMKMRLVVVCISWGQAV